MTLADGPTVAEYADRWFATHCAPPYRAEYIRKNRQVSFRLYLLPTIGHLKLPEVTTAVLSHTQRALFLRGLAHATVKTAIGHFSEMWKSARADGLVQGRPHADLAWPRLRRGKPTVFTAQERDQILAAAVSKKLWYLPQIAVMFLAGTRPSEAAGLSVHDLDPYTGQLEITQAIASRERTQGKTSKSLRSIIVDRNLSLLLVEHFQRIARQNGLMSVSRDGYPIDSEKFSTTYWKPLLDGLSIKYRPPYAMRHTFITLALMQGATAAVVAEYCGTSITEIERSYLSWIGSVQNPNAQKLMPARAVIGARAAEYRHRAQI